MFTKCMNVLEFHKYFEIPVSVIDSNHIVLITDQACLLSLAVMLFFFFRLKPESHRCAGTLADIVQKISIFDMKLYLTI